MRQPVIGDLCRLALQLTGGRSFRLTIQSAAVAAVPAHLLVVGAAASGPVDLDGGPRAGFLPSVAQRFDWSAVSAAEAADDAAQPARQL